MLYEFYGDTCSHCIEMKPIVDKVAHDLKITIERLEAWNNKKNAKKLAAIDKGLCGGVPFFYNDVAKTFICGSADEETLKAWAKGKVIEGIGSAK